MITATVRVDSMKRALEEYARALAEETSAGVVDAMAATQAIANEFIAAQAQRRTGALQQGWQPSMAGRFAGRLANVAPHAVFIDEGTRPHEIRAVRAKALRFQAGGATIFRRRVSHPGTQARPFVAPATVAGEAFLQSDMQRRADALAQAFGR